MKMIKRFYKTIFLIVGIFCFIAFNLEAASDPVVVELHYQNGVKYYKRGLYDKAIQEFEKTISLDPQNQDAKEYLETVKMAKSSNKVVDAKESKEEDLRSLYRKGRDLYGAKDYEAAKEVFSKILEIKPVDDFASFYKERCEIVISQKLAREKRNEEKQRLKDEREEKKLRKEEEKDKKGLERKGMLEKRSEINEERRDLEKEKVEAEIKIEKEALIDVRENQPSLKQQKLLEKNRSREEKIEAAQELKKEKLLAKKMRKEELAINKKASVKKKVLRSEIAKTVKKETKEAHKEARGLFLKGVEQYGRKQFQDAIDTFESLIEMEKHGEVIYTISSKTFIEKAKKRIEDTK